MRRIYWTQARRFVSFSSRLRGFSILHEGWGQLVESLRTAAEKGGATIRTGSGVRRVFASSRFEGVETNSGSVIRARSGVLAVPPRAAASLLSENRASAVRWKDSLTVKAACLDVGLRRLPSPRRRFALGIDEPDYVSVHTSVARLGNGEVLHAARYLADGASAPPQAVLEANVERLQPDFRRELVHMAYRPQMIVSYGLPRADQGGRRPAVAVPEMPGLYLAGDWVGEDGLLADAAVASAQRAGALIIEAMATGLAA